MSDTPARPAVVSPGEGEWRAVDGSGMTVRVAIDRSGVGCRNLVQRVLRYSPGARLEATNQVSEDVMYVVAGSGEAVVGETTVDLRQGTGVLVPPGTPYRISNLGRGTMELVSVLAPQPDAPGFLEAAEVPDRPPIPSLHESQEEVIPAGDDQTRGLMDRYFKLMIDPRHGCRYLTQFVGYVERSKAPAHTHTYEEVIYILGGRGMVHLDDGAHAIGPGASVYLPPGAQHCVENRRDEPLRLLGVFCPAGSPAARRPA